MPDCYTLREREAYECLRIVRQGDGVELAAGCLDLFKPPGVVVIGIVHMGKDHNVGKHLLGGVVAGVQKTCEVGASVRDVSFILAFLVLFLNHFEVYLIYY